MGEYSECLERDQHLTLLSGMLQLLGDIQCIFIQLLKLDADDDVATDLIGSTIQLLLLLASSSHIKAQERANSYLFMQWLQQCLGDADSAYKRRDLVLPLQQLFSSELMPLPQQPEGCG